MVTPLYLCVAARKKLSDVSLGARPRDSLDLVAGEDIKKPTCSHIDMIIPALVTWK